MLTEQPPINDLLRQLPSLPLREGGLGMTGAIQGYGYHYPNSVKVTTPLVSVLTHKSSVPILKVHNEVFSLKHNIHHSNHKVVSDNFDDIYKQLTSSLRKCVDVAREKGASSALPV